MLQILSYTISLQLLIKNCKWRGSYVKLFFMVFDYSAVGWLQADESRRIAKQSLGYWIVIPHQDLSAEGIQRHGPLYADLLYCTKLIIYWRAPSENKRIYRVFDYTSLCRLEEEETKE